jgi:hypothetical protein
VTTTPPKTPLSQASGKKKLLIAVPSAVLCAALSGMPKFGAIAKMLSIGFAAYAMVGLVEVLLGDRLQRANESWANLAGWKKATIGAGVVLGSLALAFSLIPLLAS